MVIATVKTVLLIPLTHGGRDRFRRFLWSVLSVAIAGSHYLLIKRMYYADSADSEDAKTQRKMSSRFHIIV